MLNYLLYTSMVRQTIFLINVCSLFFLTNVYSQSSEEIQIDNRINELLSELSEFRTEIYKSEKEATFDAIAKSIPLKSSNHCKKIPRKKDEYTGYAEEVDICSLPKIPERDKCYCEVRKENKKIKSKRKSELEKRIRLTKSLKSQYKEKEAKINSQIDQLRKEKKNLPKMVIDMSVDNDTNIKSDNSSEELDKESEERQLKKGNQQKKYENFTEGNDYLKEVQKAKSTEQLSKLNAEYSKQSLERYKNDAEYKKRQDAYYTRIRQEQENQEFWLFYNMPLEYARKYNLNPAQTQLLLATVNRYKRKIKEKEEYEKRQKEFEKKQIELEQIELERKKEIARLDEKRAKIVKSYIDSHEKRRKEYASLLNQIHINIKNKYSFKEVIEYLIGNMIKIEKTTFPLHLTPYQDKTVENYIEVPSFNINKNKVRLADYYYVTGKLPVKITSMLPFDSNYWKTFFNELRDLDEESLEDEMYVEILHEDDGFRPEWMNRYLNCIECPVILNHSEILNFIEKLNEITRMEFRLPNSLEYLTIAFDNSFKPLLSNSEQQKLNEYNGYARFYSISPLNAYFITQKIEESNKSKITNWWFPVNKYGGNNIGISGLYFGSSEIYTNKLLKKYFNEEEPSYFDQDNSTRIKSSYIPSYLTWNYKINLESIQSGRNNFYDRYLNTYIRESKYNEFDDYVYSFRLALSGN